MQTRNFFSSGNLEAYRNNPKIINALRGGALLNYTEFMTWYSQPNVRISKRNKGKRNSSAENEALHQISKTSLTQMANDVCENKIDVQYGISAILNLNFEKFDLLVAVAPDHEKIKNDETTVAPSTSLKNKTKHILGFIIAERGECRKFHDFYVVNLICTRSRVEYKKYGKNSSLERERIRGAILLGAYLFCAKRLNQDLGLLELADGYKNISGFFSYSKMGFVKDLSLFGRTCFKDFANLPMSIEIDHYSYDQIINYASGTDKIQHFDDETGLIDLVPKTPRQEVLQKQIAGLCNLTYQIDYILNGDYALDAKLDKKEIKFLESAEDDFGRRNPYDDITIDDYSNHIYDSIGELIDEFNSGSKSGSKSRSRTTWRATMQAGSNKTKKRLRKTLGY